jgi:hypothetical protein
MGIGGTLGHLAKAGHGAPYVTDRYTHLSCDDLRGAMSKFSKPA